MDAVEDRDERDVVALGVAARAHDVTHHGRRRQQPRPEAEERQSGGPEHPHRPSVLLPVWASG